MINEQRARRYCRDDIFKIENYDKAIADTTQTWHMHHRLELTLDGEFANSVADLKLHDMYYDRPASELIFLTPGDHIRLHMKTIASKETYSNRNYDAQSKAMIELWNDEDRRKEVIEHMRETGKKRRKHKNIVATQREDYRAYQREYQRIYREQHPDYYRKRIEFNKAKKNGFTGTFKEWRELEND